MSSKEVFTASSGVRLFSNLEWRLLEAGTTVDNALRAVASERGASHVVTSKAVHPEDMTIGKKTRSVNRMMGGFFSTPSEEGPGKKAHSLAAAFALWAREHNRALLTVTIPNGEMLVVVVMNGLPIYDKLVVGSGESFNIVSTYLKDYPDISVFADDVVLHPTAIHFDGSLLESIALCCDKTTAIRSVPVDSVKLAILLILVLAIASGYYFYDRKKKADARRIALLKAAQEDPVPKYLNALAVQKATLGIDRRSLTQALNFAYKLPLVVDGWRLKKAACSKADGCYATYVRGLGNFAGLKASVPYLKLNQPGSLDVNTALMAWTQELLPVAIDAAPIALDDFIQGGSGSLLQDWSVAGLTVQLQPPLLWPQVPGVPPNFKLPQALAVGSFSVSGLSLPIATEAINTAPANVLWNGWQITLDATKGDALELAKVSLTGNYYVKN